MSFSWSFSWKIILLISMSVCALANDAGGEPPVNPNRQVITAEQAAQMQNKQLYPLLESVLEMKFDEPNDLGTFFNQLMQEFNAGSQSGLNKSPVFQDIFLAIIAKAINGVPEDPNLEYGWSFADEQVGKFVRSIIKASPLTQGSINRLKAYVMAFEEADEIASVQRSLLKYLDERKQPLPWDVNDGVHEYQFAKEVQETSFRYARFNYDETKTEIVTSEVSIVPKERIDNLPQFMNDHLLGGEDQIERAQALLKENYVNPNTKVNITLLGTTGNGKTQFAKALAIARFGSKEALYKMTFTGKVGELNDYFRSSTGYVGSNEPTDFEKWFMARRETGGVILLDELFSLHGLSKDIVSEKVKIINELYDLMDERKIKFGNKEYDASKFHLVMTGNAMQELFMGLPDDPSSEKLVKRIIEKTTKSDIIKYFNDFGIDPPKIARMGEIFVNGPQPRPVVRQISQYLLRENLAEIKKQQPDIKVTVDEKILMGIVDRMSTAELGLREVNSGLSQIVMSAINGIIFDMPEAKEIEAKLIDEKLHWYVDGNEVVAIGEVIDEVSNLKTLKFAVKTEDVTHDFTKQFSDLNIATPRAVEETERYVTKVHEIKGHWMVRTLTTGRNNAETISVVPSDKYLGYVRMKDEDIIRYSSLTSIMKEIMSLEAGYLAPIQEDLYATGGGTTRPNKDNPSDDLTKVDRYMDAMENNHLIDGLTESTDENTRRETRDIIRKLLKSATNKVIEFGNENQFADELMEVINKEYYIGEEDLDEYATRKLAELDVDPDVVFLKALDDAYEEMLEELVKGKSDRFVKNAALLRSITDKAAKEVRRVRVLEVGDDAAEAFDRVVQDSMHRREASFKKYNAKVNGCLATISRILFGKR